MKTLNQCSKLEYKVECNSISRYEKIIADLYKADEAHFVIGDEISAINNIIVSYMAPNEKIILPRNIPKSVISTLILSGSTPIFINSEIDKDLGINLNITPEKVEEILKEENDIKAIFLYNPTSYSTCANIEKIISICKERNILVLVDETYGTYFPFSEELPKSTISLGADISIVNIYRDDKLPINICGTLCNSQNAKYHKVLEKSCENQNKYIINLMIDKLDEIIYDLLNKGKNKVSYILNLSRYAKANLNKIEGIRVNPTLKKVCNFSMDETKLCINISGLGISGFEVYNLLCKHFDIKVQSADLNNVVLIISTSTNKKNIDEIINAFTIIATLYQKSKNYEDIKIKTINPKLKMNPRHAFYSDKVSLNIDRCINKICAESISIHPSGNLLLVPGELISREIIENIKILKENNIQLYGSKDENIENILVVN